MPSTKPHGNALPPLEASAVVREHRFGLSMYVSIIFRYLKGRVP